MVTPENWPEKANTRTIRVKGITLLDVDATVAAVTELGWESAGSDADSVSFTKAIEHNDLDREIAVVKARLGDTVFIEH